MRTTFVIAAAAAFALAPLAARAQGASSEPGQKMQGSPNANGYGKSSMGATTTDMPATPDGTGKMHGPPNANQPPPQGDAK